MQRVHLVVDQVTLRHRIVVIKRVTPLGLGEVIAHKVEQVERVHVVEHGQIELIEYLLVQRVEVLSVVHDDFAICSGYEPFVVRLEIRKFKRIDCSVYRDERHHPDAERIPRLYEDQNDLSVPRCSQDVISAWQNLHGNDVVYDALAIFESPLFLGLVWILILNP